MKKKTMTKDERRKDENIDKILVEYIAEGIL